MSMHPVGSNPLEPQGPDNKRLLVTVALCTALWMVFNQYVMPPPKEQAPAPPPPAPAAVAAAPATPTAPAAAAAPATDDALPAQTVAFTADVAKATGADKVAVKGGYRAEVTNKGAALTAFQLTGYEDNAHRDQTTGKAPVVDLAANDPAKPRILALASRGGDVELAADATYEIVEQDAQHVTMSRLTQSGVRVTKTLTFEPARFAFAQKVVLKNEGAEKRTAQLDVLLTGQESGKKQSSAFGAPPPDVMGAVCSVNESRERESADVKEPKAFAGKVDYAGLDRHFFLAALVPVDAPTQGCNIVPATTGEGDAAIHDITVQLQNAAIELAPGEVRTLTYEAYFGPKQVGLLEAFGHGLSKNIDFGIFGILSRPMLWLLVEFHAYTGNFGIAIILLTFVVKLLTFPLTQKSYRSMQEMKKLAPEIKELQKKYGSDRALLGQKQMALYQEKGVNPMAGCFPVLVQLPVWFALYRTLASAVELYQQPGWGWIVDLTQADHSPLWGFPILPLIVGALMLAQTAMQPPPEDQPQMKYVMWGMPVMFTFFMLNMASGLSIYMITNSLLTMAQQFYIKRRYS